MTRSWRRALGLGRSQADVAGLVGWEATGDTPAEWMRVYPPGSLGTGLVLGLVLALPAVLMIEIVGYWEALVAAAAVGALRALGEAWWVRSHPRPVDTGFLLIRGRAGRYVAVNDTVQRRLDADARLTVRPVRRLGLELATRVEVADGGQVWIGEVDAGRRVRRRIDRVWDLDEVGAALEGA